MSTSVARSFALLILLTLAACTRQLIDSIPMTIEVARDEVQEFQVSFTATVINWDGDTEIHYEAFACPVIAEICADTPFHEDSVLAEKVTQPYVWNEDLCDIIVTFRASLPNGEVGEASHTTCASTESDEMSNDE